MLSVEKCKEFLKGREYTAQEIEEMRDSLYQLATILVDSHIKNKMGNKNEKVPLL